ncbi:MAG: YggS family pyridoxal phosphate-dependent enzyme [Agromyces sp.]
MDSLRERLERVRGDIADAATSVGRSADELTLIVVTKFHPASLVRDLAALGVTDVGENRHPEAGDKAAECADLAVRWHFIGQLQTNKAKFVRQYAHAVHSVDRPALATALSGDRQLDCFVQVNLTDDPNRGGVNDADLEPLIEHVLNTDGLTLRGLMAVAPLDEPARPAFAHVRALSERIQRIAPDATALSMGMSHDFADAIAEGATHLRIGTAITGNRPPAG